MDVLYLTEAKKQTWRLLFYMTVRLPDRPNAEQAEVLRRASSASLE